MATVASDSQVEASLAVAGTRTREAAGRWAEATFKARDRQATLHLNDDGSGFILFEAAGRTVQQITWDSVTVMAMTAAAAALLSASNN